jgi:Asp-tRNA(Asn)/Glu-tRNA(Gln) amidotransferase A subunit family amidase
VRERVEDAAAHLIAEAGLERVDIPVALPQGGMEWAMAGTASLLAGLGDLYPACEPDLTPEIMFACNVTTNHFNAQTAIGIENYRRKIIVATAQLFDQVDFIISATNPDVAFGVTGPLPTTIDGEDLNVTRGFVGALGNNGALTIPANTTGNPAVAIPAGTSAGLPVSMQVIGRHHAEPLLLDLALAVERARPWPLVAEGAPL